jgi:hypothetical protein
MHKIEKSTEIVLDYTEAINFRTAKKINNDLIEILRALSELEMRTEIGIRVKERFMEMVTYELQKLEESKIVL